ncbi:MAG TPA: hypothetical protein VH418_02120 [Solirubrobacteraceae bacterium]
MHRHGFVAAALVVALLAPAAAQARKINLILDYTVAGSCPVFPNYPKAGVRGNDIGWTIAPGDAVGWRYNVNRTWAMVSDRQFRGNKAGHPWWGFVERRCIGTSIGGEHFPKPTSHYPAGRHIPNRLLQGRSVHGVHHYRRVHFRVPASHVVDRLKRACSRGTLRDAANRFVIGSVAAGWRTRVTAAHSAGWTKVYVPAAKRWGWLQDTHLRGC